MNIRSQDNVDASFDPKTLVVEVRKTLKETVDVDPLWVRGVVHRGGPHYRLNGTLGPVSIGEDECVAFGQFIQEFRPSSCFIIGNAFGMSSVCIAKAMEACGGEAVITLDSKSEGDGERCAAVAEELRKKMNARLLVNKYGWSPDDIPTATEGKKFDFVLIDGDHSHPQVTRDYHGVLDLLHEKSILGWHDYWMAGVPESIQAAEADGFKCIKLNTSCEMAFGTKDEALFRQLKSTFPRAETPPVKRTRVMAHALLYAGLVRAGVRRRLGWS